VVLLRGHVHGCGTNLKGREKNKLSKRMKKESKWQQCLVHIMLAFK
jgi:hypothetical protein